MYVSSLQSQLNDPEFEAKMKADPKAAIKEAVANSPLETDVTIYRIVVAGLTAVVLFVVVGAMTLAAFGKPCPELVNSIGSASVGALAGMLVMPSRR